MKSESSKQKLDNVLGTFNLGENTSVETGDDFNCFYDEADVRMVSFVLGALSLAKVWSAYLEMIHNFVFVLLAYWVNWADLYIK